MHRDLDMVPALVTDGEHLFFFSSRRRHTRFDCDWSSDVCSSDLYPGWPLGTETGWSGRQGTTSPSFEGITAWALGADYNPLGVDFDSHMATVNSVVGPSVNFLSTDLSRFRARNGKLLMYHGTADST